MKFKIHFSILITIIVALFSCTQDYDDKPIPEELQVNNFIWRGLNHYYLWQDVAPDLSDSRFANQDQKNSFLSGFSSPLNLFNALRIDPAIDRFSYLFDDYNVLNAWLQGTAKNNGVVYGLKYRAVGSTEIFGYVRYILPNSDASSKNIKRGTVFYAVNGVPLNASNYANLLDNTTYTLNLADYNNGSITPNNQSVTLTKQDYSQNPVYVNTVINSGSHKIGYLMYNGFYANYDSQLNAAFGALKAAALTEFVLDLRYNSGGSINTATHLASMITGQFAGQVFAKQEWNSKRQSQYERENPANLLNLFTNRLNNNEAINSLNMTKVYVLTTSSTASASELVINCLKPYINVIQIGTKTTGKNVGSITLYDSPNFSSNNVNPLHRYAMQPIVLKTINKNGFGDYHTGIVPNQEVIEDIGNLGVLGNNTEPMLAATIARILTGNRTTTSNNIIKIFENVPLANQLETEMYLDISKK